MDCPVEILWRTCGSLQDDNPFFGLRLRIRARITALPREDVKNEEALFLVWCCLAGLQLSEHLQRASRHQMEDSRSEPAAAAGDRSWYREHAGSDGTCTFGCSSALRWQESLEVGGGRRRLGEMESGKRLFRGRAEDGIHPHARGVRRLPVARRICGAYAAERRKPGTRKQRGFPARAV